MRHAELKHAACSARREEHARRAGRADAGQVEGGALELAEAERLLQVEKQCDVAVLDDLFWNVIQDAEEGCPPAVPQDDVCEHLDHFRRTVALRQLHADASSCVSAGLERPPLAAIAAHGFEREVHADRPDQLVDDGHLTWPLQERMQQSCSEKKKTRVLARGRAQVAPTSVRYVSLHMGNIT